MAIPSNEWDIRNLPTHLRAYQPIVCARCGVTQLDKGTPPRPVPDQDAPRVIVESHASDCPHRTDGSVEWVVDQVRPLIGPVQPAGHAP